MAKKDIDLDSIRKVLSLHRKEFERDYGIKEIAVFGSYARGEEGGKSDVDVLVEFKEAPDLLRFIEIERRLEYLLGLKVDLVRKKALREEFKGSILREAVPV
ncbi:MAG: nucleotidyltransferase family protein [Candidatus Altiarchaeota archaeon]|nr:nucleotidyltransferase family protein [Candidatus Altiarchaeota archaeon]